MKIYILSLLATCLFLNWACSNFSTSDKSLSKFSLAKEYIKNDKVASAFLFPKERPGNDISSFNLKVSNLVIPPMLGEFGGFALKNKMDLSLFGKVYHYNQSITDSLLNLEQKLNYEPFNLNDLQSLSDKNNPDGILFFSKDFGDFVSVLLIKNKNGKDDRSILSGQNPVLHFLFIFEDNKIKNVLYQETNP
jgi:hypothetical protein